MLLMTCRAAGSSAPRTSPQAPKAAKAQPKPVIQQPAEATNTFTRANFHELSDFYLIWADLPGEPPLVTAAIGTGDPWRNIYNSLHE